jgi:hypothetical protein
MRIRSEPAAKTGVGSKAVVAIDTADALRKLRRDGLLNAVPVHLSDNQADINLLRGLDR